MKELEKLTQDEFGRLNRKDGSRLHYEGFILVGKLKTFVVKHPCLDTSNVIDELIEQDPTFVPYYANAYVATDFNSDTQFERNGKMYLTYAIQFYNVIV